MPRAVQTVLLIALGLAALAGGYFFSQRVVPTPRLEHTDAALVDFSLPDLDGKSHWLSEWRGRVVVLNFWATWCGPCRHEIPLFIETQKRLGDEVQFVGIAIDDPAAVKGYAAEMKINYAVLLADQAGMDIMSRYGNPQGFLPYTVVFDRAGKIVERKLGPYTAESLNALLKPLLEKSTGS